MLRCVGDVSRGNNVLSATNWAGNLTFRAANLVAPKTLAEAQETVRGATKLRVVGSRHCFNDIADTTDTQLSLEHLRGVVALDTDRHQVTVEGGARYSDASPWLHGRGYALHNQASLPHVTIAGACATATHGSGAKLGNLATAVAAIEFIDAEGDLVTLSREKNPDTFPGAAVSLGALGVITKLTLDLQQSFAVRQNVYCNLPMTALEAHFDEIMAAGYSVSLFTSWQGDIIEQVWIKSRAEASSLLDGLRPFFGAAPASDKMHPMPDANPINCTEQMGSVGTILRPPAPLPHRFRAGRRRRLSSRVFCRPGARRRGREGPRQMGARLVATADDLGDASHRRRRSVAEPLLWPALRRLPFLLQT